MTEKYLYKIISTEDWKATQELKVVKLPESDSHFIHLAKEDQLHKIITKFWKNSSKFIILKIDPKKLIGNLVFEANPGGINKYYHLYKGSIPFNAIVESKIGDHS